MRVGSHGSILATLRRWGTSDEGDRCGNSWAGDERMKSRAAAENRQNRSNRNGSRRAAGLGRCKFDRADWA